MRLIIVIIIVIKLKGRKEEVQERKIFSNIILQKKYNYILNYFQINLFILHY